MSHTTLRVRQLHLSIHIRSVSLICSLYLQFQNRRFGPTAENSCSSAKITANRSFKHLFSTGYRRY